MSTVNLRFQFCLVVRELFCGSIRVQFRVPTAEFRVCKAIQVEDVDGHTYGTDACTVIVTRIAIAIMKTLFAWMTEMFFHS
jgi:hypothetical protein